VQHESDDETRARERQEATARGESIRARLLERLRADGPQSASELHPQLDRDVSLSEVAFQLDRLTEERKIDGEAGGIYRAR
jgi:DNA-binding Lrp family transcriptional regulator